MKTSEHHSTQNTQYTQRLLQLESLWWKKVFDAQAPYRWNLRRLRLGRTLDIGCGVGRNLLNLQRNGQSNGIGIDHNADSIAEAKRRGLEAYTVQEFSTLGFPSGSFDSLLISHVLEHMDSSAMHKLLGTYLPLLKKDGRLVLITPQEAGFASDPTHVEFFDFSSAQHVAGHHKLELLKQYSFPFPRWVGTFFKHNEFVSLLRTSK